MKKEPKAQEGGGDYYEVEAILDKRLTHSGLMYLIRWKDYPDSKDFTWEPIQHLTEVEDLVREFNLKDQQRAAENKEEREKSSKKEGNSSEEETSDKATRKKRGRKRGERNKEKKEKKSEMANVKSDESEAEEIKPRRFEPKKDKEQKRTRASQPQTAPAEDKEVDKFWEKEGLELGRICRHFREDDDLIYLVNLNKGDLVYGTVQLTSEELRSICEEKVVKYMENWVRNQLIAKKAKEGREYNEMSNFWNSIA